MKYFFLIFCIFGLSACFSWNSSDNESNKWSVSDIKIWGVQISDSGVSVSDGTSTIVTESGRVSIENNTFIISTGTGVKIQSPEMVDIEKDPEIQSITDDIDSIFSDIEGKK